MEGHRPGSVGESCQGEKGGKMTHVRMPRGRETMGKGNKSDARRGGLKFDIQYEMSNV